MALKITKAQVWAGDIADQPGGLAAVLEPLGAAKVNLEFVIGRRKPEKPGKGVVFMTPVKGKKGMDAARAAGLKPSERIGTLRVEGNNKPGIGAQMTRALADAGISFRGVSAAAIGNKFVAYLGFDGLADADQAAKILKKIK